MQKMIRNYATIWINGINLTHYAVMPLKWGNFLDERLDEMYISLRRCPIENFKPLTPVEIQFVSTLYFGPVTNTVDTENQTKRYIIADDQNATENPVGSGFYDHDLYIIELTKLLECIAVDTNTITNDLGRNYTNNAFPVLPVITGGESSSYSPVTPSSFVSPLKNESFTFSSAHTIFPYELGPSPGSPLRWKNSYIQNVYFNNSASPVFTNTYIINSPPNSSTEGQDIGFTTTLLAGFYKVVYEFVATTQTTPVQTISITATYTFLVVQNQLRLKQWTITDVINRLCDIAEPIRQGETPRFQLNAEQAAKYDNILAPQFSFTKSTFRECLQQCGKIVHGEPRLDIATNSDGSFYYEISFDEYGKTEKSDISKKRYISKTTSQGIESYASQLDSSAENLVNQLDKYAGVIVEPYRDGYKTVRTETMYVRITEENMLIPTQYPIYTIEKLECGFIPGHEDLGQNIDIPLYVFESSIYNTRLSSYDSLYPYSKAYAVTYTQGQKNITALNFKPENPISSVFENYSVVNILRAATGNNSITLDGNDYAYLAFRVTYTPFYNSRVGQTKLNYGDYPYAATLIYNQQSNIIESRYYGENLKGAIARLGNVEKSITYNLSRLSDIPKAGQMFDDDYYISAVSVEFLPTYIKCTLGLSKDFNRLSQYIGISSVKRFSEVSQTQAAERNTLWKEYIVVGDQTEADTDCYIGPNMMQLIANAFTQTESYAPLTNVVAWGISYGGNAFGAVNLPVIASAFGNSVAFSWTYEDNYSAGAIASWQTGGVDENEVSGLFQNNYQYTDYYGKIYYYAFDFEPAGESPTTEERQGEIGIYLPQGNAKGESSGYLSTIGQSPLILRKDNREALQCNFQIDFVSNRKGLIIGSALAAYCSAVRPPDSKLTAYLYVFNVPLNKFIDHVEGSIDTNFNIDYTGYPITVSVTNTGFSISLNSGTFPKPGQAWAICTPQWNESIDVEDEQGNQTTQVIQHGGDVLLAQNGAFTDDDTFETIYFTKKREVFDKTVWKANR